MERRPLLDTCLYEIVSLFSVWAVSLTSLPHHELAHCVHIFWFPFYLFEVWEIWQTLFCTWCKVGVDQCGSKLSVLTTSIANSMEIFLVFLMVQHLHKPACHSLYLFTNHFQTCGLQGFHGSVYLGCGLLECDAMEYSNH